MPRGSVQYQVSALDAAGQPVAGVTATWRSSVPGVATISPSGLASAQSIGTTTISATIGTATGTATLRVIPAAASIRLAVPFPIARVGRRIRLGATVRDDTGAEIGGRRIEWTSRNRGVATVDSAGLVTAVIEGSTMITVQLGTLADSAVLAVGPALAVTATDSMVVPGEQFRIRGGGLDQAEATIAGRRLTPTVALDTLLAVFVPDDLFGPCVSDSTTTSLSVTTAVGPQVELRRPVAEQPFVATLARGRHLDLSAAHRASCRVAIDSAGEYVAMVYSAEAGDASRLQSDSLDLVFEAAVLGAPSASRTAAMPRPEPLLPSWTAGLASDVVLSPTTASVPCPLPTRIGDTIRMSVQRNAEGRVSSIAHAGYPIEDWELIGLAARVAFFIDSTTKRAMASDARVADLIGRTVAFADTGAVPFLERVTRGFPDKDQDGRVIAYITTNGALGAGGLALPWSSYRADCGVVGPAGESVVLDLVLVSSPIPPFVEPTLSYGVVLHELAHIADMGWYPSQSVGHLVVLEGFATFLQAVYPGLAGPEPLVANRDVHPAYSDNSAVSCFFYPSLFLPVFYDARHTVGCHFASYLFARRRAATGESFRESAVRWSSTDMAVELALWAERYLGTPGRGASVFAEWLLSWYTDDFVSGVTAELQNPYWNSRAAWARYFAPNPHFVGATEVGARTARFPLRLGSVDARYFELRATQATRLSLRGMVPAVATGKIGLVLLRR